jgi:NET1-associated nuclear protein 1 (U3 small nucleolar RNA-associated protein 17)
VGITKAWSVVLVGDDVRLPEDEGSTGKGILGGPASHKKTIFQDIFGKSAFTGLSSELRPEVAIAPTHSRTSNKVAGIPDGPAYLMPPLESLYEPLMGNFLKLRSQADDYATGLVPGQGEDEDFDLRDENSTAPVLSVRHPGRIVTQDEMNLFVDLFKRHAVKSVKCTSCSRVHALY